ISVVADGQRDLAHTKRRPSISGAPLFGQSMELVQRGRQSPAVRRPVCPQLSREGWLTRGFDANEVSRTGEHRMEQRLGRSSQSDKREAGTVAGAYLALLANRGVDYLFGNAGTDFAPLIEAYSQAAQTGVPVPRPILATHENLAV